MIEKIASTESPQGREISFYRWKINDSLPNAFILGGFHGDEPEGVYAVEHFMQESFFKTSCAADFNVYFLPCLNPDGKAAKTRVNANKVDLNRNYPTKNFEKTAQPPRMFKHIGGHSCFGNGNAFYDGTGRKIFACPHYFNSFRPSFNGLRRPCPRTGIKNGRNHGIQIR